MEHLSPTENPTSLNLPFAAWMQITFVDKTVLKCRSENDFHCMTIYRSKDQLPD